nr:YiiX/YebB-like N1pC/P60 family cysteine hydrolase [Methylobacterium sp. Leaf122]
MKRINIDKVKPGDILLTARPGKLSKAIRTATNGTVSHALICVQRSSFIDSTSNGVQASNLQRELFDDNEQAFHFRLKVPPGQGVIEQVVDYARAEVGARYSIGEAVRSVVSARKRRSRKQFCSRLVAQVYSKAGIELVPNGDYCSPEDLRRSPLLQELPIDFETVSAEELDWMSNHSNPIRAMHDAQNTVLKAARTVDPGVEHFNDLYELLIRRQDADAPIAVALESSGYLEIWRMEVEKYPWRYVHGLMDKLSAPREAICQYCIGTLREAYSGGYRFSINLTQLRALHQQHPRKSFGLEIALYETLVSNDQSRREVAYDWLQRHHPDLLRQHMQEIEPHTPSWWSVVDRVDPALAALSRQAVAKEGGIDVCSICGDRPAFRYRVVNGADAMPGVPSLRLCDDCTEIRRGMGTELMPFLSERREQ